MNQLNLRYMLFGTPTQLRHSRRWATSRVLFPENVAEHSWFVCFYSMMIARWVWHQDAPPSELKKLLGNQTLDNFLGKVLQRAVIHDLEEARSGDVHRPFKYSTPELSQALKNAATAAAHQTIDPLAPGSEADAILTIWHNAKDDTHAGRIVRFADLLAVLAFVKQEGPGAHHWLSLDTLPQLAAKFERRKFDFIRPLVDEAKNILTELMGL